LENYGSLDEFYKLEREELRKELLKIYGIGKETADIIILYSAEKPIFVVDKYTKELFKNLGLIKGNEEYDEIRRIIEKEIEPNEENLWIFKEYHALIDIHMKTTCKKKKCDICPLKEICLIKNKF